VSDEAVARRLAGVVAAELVAYQISLSVAPIVKRIVTQIAPSTHVAHGGHATTKSSFLMSRKTQTVAISSGPSRMSVFYPNHS
jgi:hypothetical protein